MKELKSNPYFELFNGKEVRISDVERAAPFTHPAIRCLTLSNKVIGQHTLDGDLVLWMPEKTSFSGVLPEPKTPPADPERVQWTQIGTRWYPIPVREPKRELREVSR